MSDWVDVPLKEKDLKRVLLNVESLRVLLDQDNKVFVCDVNDSEGMYYEADMSYESILQLIISPVTISVGVSQKEKIKTL